MRASWLVVAGWIWIAGCGGECQAVCKSFVVVSAVVDRPVTALDGTSLVYCRNGACTLPVAFTDGGVIESAGLCATVYFASEQATTTTIAVSVDLETDHCVQPVLHDGDRYSMTLTDPNGATIANAAATATYHSQTSCGTHCESAVLELEPI